jgi:NAD(P)-dependent dehydrogenase (short-subunit alcohol dehydrogenase family)
MGSADIVADVGSAEVAVVDAVDEKAVEEHARLHIAAVPETFPQDIHTDVFDAGGEGGGMGGGDLVQMQAQMTMLRRVTTLANVADVAAFLASDWSGGMTGTILNVTGGMVVD